MEERRGVGREEEGKRVKGRREGGGAIVRAGLYRRRTPFPLGPVGVAVTPTFQSTC